MSNNVFLFPFFFLFLSPLNVILRPVMQTSTAFLLKKYDIIERTAIIQMSLFNSYWFANIYIPDNPE